MSREEPAPIHFDIFPLPQGRRMLTTSDLPRLETGERFLSLERSITDTLFGLQPVCDGPLASLRAYCSAMLFQQTGINLGFGKLDWGEHTLSEWFRRDESEWVFLPKHLLWEITIGLSMWVGAFVGAPLDQVIEWNKDFCARATDEEMMGDFSNKQNNAQRYNIPCIDALVAFFRDTLLNRLLELIPRLSEKATSVFDEDAIRMVRMWTLPPRSLWPYVLKADEMKPRDVFSSLRKIGESVKSRALRAGLLYKESEESTHLERIETVKLSGYYTSVDYTPPADSLIAHDSVSMYWPSAVEGPINHKRADSMSDYLNTYLHHFHIVYVDDRTVGWMQTLIASPSQGDKRAKMIQQINDIRRGARDSLQGLVETLEPSRVQQTQYKAIVQSWFSDLE